MVPSNASDFANNDPKTLSLDFVNPTGPDIIGEQRTLVTKEI
jgi:hypothetical protein